MKKRAKVGGASATARRPKAMKLNRRDEPKAPHFQSSPNGEETEVARLTRERDEAIQQQTATSEVLRIIHRSPADTQPVFNAIVESAVRLSGAIFCVLYLYDGDRMRIGATSNFSSEAISRIQEIQELKRPERSHLAGRAILERAIVHVHDALEDPEYSRELAQAGGWRAVLSVPLIRDGTPLGALSVGKAEPTLFSNRQVQLLQTFADQAVIAIENARLLNELRESLQQQTATSEVLGVISSSPGDVEPVFQAMLQNAVRICDATFGNIYRWDGTFLDLVTGYNTPPEYIELRKRKPFRADNPFHVARMINSKSPVHTSDLSDEVYAEAVQIGSFKTLLCVPMLKNDDLVGAVIVSRAQVRPFTDKQIELVQNFAAQAVIAIENVRLLNELRKRTDDLTVSLEQQTATSEVLSVISRSKFDLQPILQSVVDTAARLCRANQAVIFRLEGGAYRFAAGYSIVPAYLEIERQTPISPGPGTLVGRTAMSQQVARIDDAWTDPLYEKKEDAKIGGHRSMIGVPLMRGGEPVGVIGLSRSRVDAFSEREIELVTTFADQAVIAIENVRLFENVEARTRELTRSLEDLQTAQDRLVQTEKLASLGQLTAGIAHEIKNPLNFVNNFSSVSVELIDELREALDGVHLNDKQRVEINEIADMLQGNLDKVVQHGQRADSIVKNMLLHSRQGSGEHRPVDINALVEESLNLAYHGARAEKQGFNITLEKSFDPAAGQADLFPQEITRVLLNLISNGFYAATKRKPRPIGATTSRCCCRDQEPRRQGGNPHPRQRHRHTSGGEGEDVQSVLHDKACR